MAKKSIKIVKNNSLDEKAMKKLFLTRTPVRRLMKDEGAKLVSDEALDLMISKLEELAIKTTKKAMELVKDEKRRRLTADDITWASK
jgi:histone H3/H4